MEFRNLTEDDIEVRVQKIYNSDKWSGVSLLLYKNARVDMNILDETVGVENWQNKFYECCGNLFCSLGINIGGNWIWKDDSGVEGFSGEIKSTASDARKRAGFAWGIGRELYTAPTILIGQYSREDTEKKKPLFKITENNGKLTCKTKFIVRKIEVVNKKITMLVIGDERGNVLYEWATNKIQ